MEQLPADWDTIQGHLQGISGFDPKVLKPYYEEGPAKKGIHFFLIQYAPGEVIMAKGTTSDYAAVHLQGRVRVRDVVPAYRTSGRGCWERAIARRLENLVLTEAAQWPADKKPSRGLFGWLAPLYRRLPGLPIRLIDFCEHWLSPKMALKLRAHVARALHGRLPKVRRLERELSDPNANPAQLSHVSHAGAEPCVTVHDVEGRAKPLEDRFMGITGTLWNQPRSVTLVAENEGAKPCLMLLIKRKALEEIIKKSPRFYEKKMADFVSSTLPDVLAKNRLFRERLFVEEVRDWPALLAALHPDSDAAEWVRGLRGRLPRSFLRWLDKSDLANLDASEKFQIVEKLNGALAQQPVEGEAAWLPAGHDEARELLKRRGALNDCEIARLNRLLLEAALPGAFAPSPRPFPLSRDEFRDFTAALLEEHQRKFGKALQPDRVESKKGERKGTVLFKQGDPADSIYLILSGMVRIHVELPGGRTMVNNFEADQYFGETAVLEDGAGGGPPLRTAGVETLCSSTLLRLDRDVLRALFAGRYRALGEKLERQRQLLSVRDEQMRVGRLLPPTEPPGDIAERLMLTRNLLLIDMGKCTRCDQCVRGCAEAHDGQPRFHRANPSLRFGRWEAAGACLHCLDAPCQQVCPVGAITWLDNGAVQIHRDRCIGCSQCANECPFGVVDMYEPTSPEDAPSSKKGIVANKCDLCLTEDHDPPCVACCPYDAARRVDPVAFFPDLKSWANFADRA